MYLDLDRLLRARGEGDLRPLCLDLLEDDSYRSLEALLFLFLSSLLLVDDCLDLDSEDACDDVATISLVASESLRSPNSVLNST